MTTRRSFLKTSSLAAVVAAGQSSRLYRIGALHTGRRNTGWNGTPNAWPHVTDPEFKALALRALDAARSGGASYADVRFTVTQQRTFQNTRPATDTHGIAMGVRALANGAWGFAANTHLTPDVAAALGNKAAELARVTAWPRVPPIQLTDRPPAATGHWVTPVTRDPFTVPTEEVETLIQSIAQHTKQLRARFGIVLTFQRQDRVFASTDGAYATQTIYTSLGGSPHRGTPMSQFAVGVQNPQTKRMSQYAAPFVTPMGAGYEVVEDAKILEHIPEWVEKAREFSLMKKFDTMGVYDVVFDAAAMAAIVDGTFGAALEYDRAVGYEAGATGSSYLAPPFKILDTAQAPAAVTISADRSMPGGTATVQWDDEGVTPRETTFVKHGVVTDYAISREFVSELAPWYRKHGEAVSSNGCAASESARDIPLVYTPNLTLHPAVQDTSVADLVAHIDDGLLICGGEVNMDFQQTSGLGQGAQTYLIKHGKVSVPVSDAAYAFNTQQLWKNLVRLGGAQTAGVRGLPMSKGEPNQVATHSVRAVAAHFKDVHAGSELTI